MSSEASSTGLCAREILERFRAPSNGKTSDPNRTVILWGPAGSGKSTIAQATAAIWGEEQASGYVRVQRSGDTSKVSLITELTKAFGTGPSVALLDEYWRTNPQTRPLLLRQVQEAIVADLNSCDNPLIIIDETSNLRTHLQRWLEQLLDSVGTRVCVLHIVSDPTRVGAVGALVQVPQFRTSDMFDLIDAPDEAERWRTARLLALVGALPVDALTTQYVWETSGLTLPDQLSSREELGRWLLARIPKPVLQLVVESNTAKLRWNSEARQMMAGDSDWPESALDNAARSFPALSVHEHEEVHVNPDYNRWISTSSVFSEKESLRSQATLGKGSHVLAEQLSERERFRYFADRLVDEMVRNPHDGLQQFTSTVSELLERGDVDDADILIARAEDIKLPGGQQLALQQIRARQLLADYDSDSAARILRDLRAGGIREGGAVGLAEQLLLEAACVVGPVPVPNADIFYGISLLEQFLEIEHAARSQASSVEALLMLGRALRATGQSVAAESRFMSVTSLGTSARDKRLTSLALMEVMQTRRYAQDLPGARAALRMVYEYRGEFGVAQDHGILRYFEGNLIRDEDDFPGARERYSAAEPYLAEQGDYFNLACLYGDWSWLEYLAGDIVTATGLLDKGYAISQRFSFGTEVAEYWHTKYHIARDYGSMDDAYRYIELGRREALRSNNIYMILDCAMHTAEKYRDTGRHGDIPAVLEEMERLESRGCTIRVFRGRTLIVYGDSLHAQGKLWEAYLAFVEGLKVVAHYGESRTNVELLGDVVASRGEVLKGLLVEYGTATALKKEWIDAGLAAKYPQVVELCDLTSAES